MAQQRNTPPRRAQTPTSGAPRPQATRTTAATTKRSFIPKSNGILLFGRTNFIYMLAGIALIAVGLVMMSGGKQPDANTWDPNIIYSTRITVVAPILILAGLIVEFWAIFKKDTTVATETATKTAE